MAYRKIDKEGNSDRKRKSGKQTDRKRVAYIQIEARVAYRQIEQQWHSDRY